MTKGAFTTLAALLVLPAPASPAAADDVVGERSLITDPVLLERMGFEPGAMNVYATPSALARLDASTGTQAYAEAVNRSPFGTGTAGFSTLAAIDFRPVLWNSEHNVGNFSLQCFGGDHFFDTNVQDVPHGARLEEMRIWYFDVSPENLAVILFRVCTPDSHADGEPEVTNLATIDSAGSPGWSSLTAELSEDVDRQSCSYIVRVRLDSVDGGACSEATDLRLGKVRLQWRRQVSPAPQTATFDDVQPTHLFFQQIEALAASGITGGCGGGNFCPGAPLTRGQMAAFLAKALGLHWGEIAQ